MADEHKYYGPFLLETYKSSLSHGKYLCALIQKEKEIAQLLFTQSHCETGL